ncbi:hypothetical protein CGCTS75_v004535 [Colletotrichum tropicale]|nr:hypothetical protein CGCTS75_v004535 [Colletotrichum tropicale]
MAEVLGLAASVIAVVDVAAKTGSAYVRIQKLWSEVKNVPNLLREKAEDIQIFEDFLANVEDNLAISPLPALASDRILLEKLICRCRSVLEELQDMVDRIYTRITSERGLKHKIASAKAALKKDDLEALSLKFDRALRIFQMAQAEERRRIAIATFNAVVKTDTNVVLYPRNSATVSMIRTPMQKGREAQDDDIRSREWQIIQDTRSDPTELNIFGKFCFGFEQNGGFHALFAAPSWLGLSVYSVFAQKASMGWQINLRTHEIVDNFDADFYDLIHKDDVNGLLKYMHDRGLGLCVRDSMGFGLLDTAISRRSLNITRALLNNGLSIEIGNTIRGWLIGQAIGLWYSDYECEDCNLPLVQILGENGLDDFLEADGLVWVLDRGINLEGFCVMLNRRAQGPELSVEERLRFFRAIVYHSGSNWWTLDQLSSLVPKASLREEAWLVDSRLTGHYSLLQSLAVGAINPLLSDEPGTEESTWAQMLTDCIRVDPLGLQHADPGKPFHLPSWENPRSLFTPLSAMISQACLKQRFSSAGSKRDFSSHLERVFRFWINILATAGIDLLAYGRSERRFHESEQAGKFRGFLSSEATPNRHYDHGPVNKGACRHFIAGFTYGRLAEHWKLWITCENYEYAGDFWNMIDDQATSMPGSWGPDPVNREQENWRWMNMENPPLIWSEYRKIKPPV